MLPSQVYRSAGALFLPPLRRGNCGKHAPTVKTVEDRRQLWRLLRRKGQAECFATLTRKAFRVCTLAPLSPPRKGGCRFGKRVPHGDGLRLPRGTSSVCALSLRAGASLRRALKSPTGAFSRAPLSPPAALRCGSGCAPAPAAASASPRFRPRAPCRSLLFAAPSARKVRVAFLLALRSAAPLLARSLASAPCARSGSLPPCYRVGARSPSTHRASSPQRFPPACRLAAPAPRRGALGVAPCGVSASGGRVPRPPPLIKPLLSSRGGG